MDGRQPSASGVGDRQENPSAALDQLFLELHDQIPKDTRGKLAQLANEVQKLKDTSTSAAQTTPRPSSDQELARREEETVEARQSSGELTKDEVVISTSEQPTLRDIVCFAVPHIAPKWYDVGIALDVQSLVLDGIEHDQKSTAQPRTMFVKWLQKSPGTGGQARTWKSVLEAISIICGQGAVAEICTAVHIQGYTTRDGHGETKPTGHSSTLDLQRKRSRSSTKSSEEFELEQQPAVKKQLHEYMELKMDLLDQDISDLRSETDPTVIIKLLHVNTVATISKLLEPHLDAVKKAADRVHQADLHHGTVVENEIASADSIDSLLRLMSVTRMWDKTRFLRKAVGSIPRSAPERGVAEAILSHYNLHLAICEQATLLKDALAKESESEEEGKPPAEDTKLVPLKITAQTAFNKYTCEDCHRLQARVLSAQYGIPEEKIINVEERRSTTVTFLVPGQYANCIMQRSTQLDTIWILLELRIIEVFIPGVFTFSPSVGCFLTLLRGRKALSVDLLSVTEILPYQMYCLIDPNTKEPLSGRPLSTKRTEQYWDYQDESVSNPRSSLPESEDNIPAIQSDDAVIPVEVNSAGAFDETHSRVCELEDKVKDLKRKVANLFMDNVALTAKLKASREVDRQQQEEVTSLKERLVQALRAQETATREQSLSKARESECEDKIRSLEAEKSDLEATVDRMEKQIMQLEEIRPSDIEQLVKSMSQGSSTDKQEAVSGETAKITEKVRKGSTEETVSATVIKSFKTEELFQYLSLHLDENIAQVMKNHNVSGDVFLELTEEEMKEIFPLLGDRKKVLLLRSRCFAVHTYEDMAAASCSATPRMKPENLDGRFPIELAPDSAVTDLIEVIPLEVDSSARQSHESVLEDVCWIPSGIESLFITPLGGLFPLQPEGGEEGVDEDMIQLHVPQGAVSADGEGVLEVRYAVIPDGPFRTPEGYRLCSMAVYLYYNPHQTTKPFYLKLPNWSDAAEHPTFVTSPHTLPEGESHYQFHLLEGGEFNERYGTLEVDGHSTLFGQAYRLEDTSRYYASLWERDERNAQHSKVAITYADQVWIQILKRYWKNWKKVHNVQFRFVGDLIEGSLDVKRGRGWDASTVGPNKVSAKDVEFKTEYKRHALKEAVIEEVYPPSITVKAVSSQVPKHLRRPRHVCLRVSGTSKGELTFPVEVSEEKEAPSVVAVNVPSEEGSSERPDSSKHPALTTIRVLQVLERYEDEFFEVVNAKKLNLLKLKRKKVITADLISKIESADDENAKEILFDHLKCNADMANLREYCEVVIAADGYPKMQQLGEKMLSELPTKCSN